MTNSKLIVTEYRNFEATFLFEDSDITELFLSKKKDFSVNDIYVGRVSRVKADIKACFVDFSDSQTGFLPFAEICGEFLLNRTYDGRLKQGDLVCVQISKEPVKTKGATLTMNISIPGVYSVVTATDTKIHISSKIPSKISAELHNKLEPFSGEYGFIVRTNGAEVPTEKITEEVTKNRAVLADLVGIMKYRPAFTNLYKAKASYIEQIKSISKSRYSEIVTDKDEMFESLSDFDNVRLYKDSLVPLKAVYSFDKAYELATSKEVMLKGGGFLVIEPTEALTVIDVNSGKFEKNCSKEDAIHQINLSATKEIARQLRLRNLSGIILVDFINYTDSSKQEELITTLKAELKKDLVKASFIDITPLGLAEITREKRYSSIYDQIR